MDLVSDIKMIRTDTTLSSYPKGKEAMTPLLRTRSRDCVLYSMGQYCSVLYTQLVRKMTKILRNVLKIHDILWNLEAFSIPNL